MAIDSIVRVYAYLETDFLWKTSSVASPETAGLRKIGPTHRDLQIP